MATDTAFNAVLLQDVRQAQLPFIASSTPGQNGTSVSTSLPSEVAVAVTLRTGKIGPGGRGRFYVPNWATNALGTGNTVTAAAVTALQNWASNIDVVLAGQAMTWSLGLQERAAYTSPTTGTLHPHRDAQTLDVTQILVRDNHWDSQRRRGLE